MVRHLAGLDEIALDTEGDSLHHYPERLALIQIADRADQAWLVDPLALADLEPLGKLVGGGRPQGVLHAGDNDLVPLKRRYGFTVRAILDTSLAARLPRRVFPAKGRARSPAGAGRNSRGARAAPRAARQERGSPTVQGARRRHARRLGRGGAPHRRRPRQDPGLHAARRRSLGPSDARGDRPCSGPARVRAARGATTAAAPVGAGAGAAAHRAAAAVAGRRRAPRGARVGGRPAESGPAAPPGSRPP